MALKCTESRRLLRNNIIIILICILLSKIHLESWNLSFSLQCAAMVLSWLCIVAVGCVCQRVLQTAGTAIQTVLGSVMNVRLATCLTTRTTPACVSFLFAFVMSTHVTPCII